MFKKILFCVLIFLLVGCDDNLQPLSNDQIISETKKCQSAGMKPHYFHSETFSIEDPRIVIVQCQPIEFK